MAIVLAFFDTRLGKYLLMAMVAVAAAAAFGAHERGIGYREAVDAYATQRKAEEDAYLALMEKRQTAFNTLETKIAELAAQRDSDLVAKDKQRKDELAALKERINAYVTPASTRSCPDVPRSYLMFRSDAAAYANRTAPSIPTATASDATPTASGVSLEDLAGADSEQAGAYRACAERNDAWLKYKADVEAAWAEVQRVLGGT